MEGGAKDGVALFYCLPPVGPGTPADRGLPQKSERTGRNLNEPEALVRRGWQKGLGRPVFSPGGKAG